MHYKLKKKIPKTKLYWNDRMEFMRGMTFYAPKHYVFYNTNGVEVFGVDEFGTPVAPEYKHWEIALEWCEPAIDYIGFFNAI